MTATLFQAFVSALITLTAIFGTATAAIVLWAVWATRRDRIAADHTQGAKSRSN